MYLSMLIWRGKRLGKAGDLTKEVGLWRGLFIIAKSRGWGLLNFIRLEDLKHMVPWSMDLFLDLVHRLPPWTTSNF